MHAGVHVCVRACVCHLAENNEFALYYSTTDTTYITGVYIFQTFWFGLISVLRPFNTF